METWRTLFWRTVMIFVAVTIGNPAWTWEFGVDTIVRAIIVTHNKRTLRIDQ